MVFAPSSQALRSYATHGLLAAMLARDVLRLVRLARLHGVAKLIKDAAAAALALSTALVPAVRKLVAAETQKALDDIERDMLGEGDPDAHLELPPRGLGVDVVESAAAAMVDAEMALSAGRKWAGVYHTAASELSELQGRVWSRFVCTNALYPQVNPSVRKFEAEIVQMTLGIVHGPEAGAVGLLASGGTEAVLLAALAYREDGRRRGIARPQIIASLSAHPAILKACQYFGIELVTAPFDAVSKKFTAPCVAPLLTSRTVAIYASAPTFCHGVVDDIPGLAELASSRGVGLHVDNCLGGYLLSFMSDAGLLSTPFDFAVPGVTTMSIDVHKYGFAPKGASVVAFRDPAMRAATLVPSTEGCEGLYVTPTLQGSRSGATIAAVWATLVHTGRDGYARYAREIAASFERLKAAVREMPRGVALCADADACNLPICGDGSFDIYALATLLTKKGWGVFTGQKPPTCTIPVGEQTAAQLDELIEDLREAVGYLLEHPETKPEGTAAVYGAAQTLPSELLESILRGYIDVRLKVKAATVTA